MLARFIASAILTSMLIAPIGIINTAKEEIRQIKISRLQELKEIELTCKGATRTAAARKEIATKKAIQEAEERQRKLQEQKVVYAPARTAAVDNPKDKVAMYESHANYNAVNGRYIGKYQLDQAYLNGDYSIENQERTAEAYVQQRYGSWQGAWEHIQQYGWY